MQKEYNKLNEQINKLKSRGLIIDDKSKVKKILQKENYYNIINGYKELFIDYRYKGIDERYINGTKFDEIYNLYYFDRNLRGIFFKYILEVENNIKSVLASDFSKKYGHDNYLKIDNFNPYVKLSANKTRSEKIGDIADLIAGIQKEVSNQLRKNNSMISHHILQYGYIPFWVLINKLSLGTVSMFYSHLKDVDKNDIGRIFSLKPDEMNNILSLLTVYRNACAHDERIYSLKSIKKNGKPNNIKTCDIHKKLSIPFNLANNPIYGKNDLFAVVIVFKLILNKKSMKKFVLELDNCFYELGNGLHTIKIDIVMDKMGFPLNWIDIKDI